MTLNRLYFSILFILSFSLTFAQNAPANNTYQTATTLTVQAGSCSSQTQGDLAYATNTNNKDYSSSCLEPDYDETYAYRDVWYKATVPSTGKITFKITYVAESKYKNAQTVAYTLADDALTEISCTEGTNISSGGEYTHSLTGLTQGTEIYVMVVSPDEVENGFVGSGGSDLFNICAFDPDGVLGVPTVPKTLLSYHNPVGNSLRLESPYKIQSLAIHDLAGREVLTKSPQKQKLWLNTYSLSSGVYLLNVQTAEGEQTVKLIKK